MGVSAQNILQSDPEYLRRQIAQQEMQRLNPRGTAAGAIGSILGRGAGNLASGRGFFDVSDPALKRVSEVQGIMQGVQFDPDNPQQYYKDLASQLSSAGFADLAPLAAAEAAKFTAKAGETKVLPPGAVLVDAQGNIIAEGKATKSELEGGAVSVKTSPEWTRYQELLSLGTPEREARSIAYKTNATDFRRDLETSKRLEKVEKQEQKRETTVATIDNVMNTVDKALGQVNAFTAGAVGTPLSFLPGTSAKDLDANLTTIKANLGFDRLQQMRDASPTGGALGQVAVQELVALQSTIGSLDNQQSPKQLRQNLQKVKYHYTRWRDAVNKAKGQQTIGTAAEPPVGVDPAVWGVMTPEERSLWQN